MEPLMVDHSDTDRDPGSWRGFVATSEFELTPTGPVHLAASGDTSNCTADVADPISATCVLLESEGTRIILLSADLLYAGSDLVRALTSELSQTPGIDQSAIFATHTHFAPATDRSKPLLGEVDPLYLQLITRNLRQSIRELVTAQMEEVQLSVTRSTCDFGVNRRKRWPVEVTRSGVRLRPVVSGVNHGGPKDDLVTVATFTRVSDGSPVAVLWNYACHPVGRFRRDQISAHFVGDVRRTLRESLGREDLAVLYLQGFSGDVRPNHRDTNAPSRSGIERARCGPGYSTFTKAGYREWTHDLATHVSNTALLAPELVCGSGIRLKSASVPRSLVLEGSRSDASVTFQSYLFGEDLLIVGASVEAVTEYAKFVRSLARQRWVMPAGCMDDVAGYAPTARMLKEGGYEAGGFCRAFSASAVPATVEDAIKSGLRAVVVG